MDNERILELIEKGVTPEEVRTMLSNTENKAEPEPEQNPEAQNEQPEAGEVDENSILGAHQHAINELTDIVADLANTIKAIQGENIKNATGGSGDAVTAADVIANFIENT